MILLKDLNRHFTNRQYDGDSSNYTGLHLIYYNMEETIWAEKYTRPWVCRRIIGKTPQIEVSRIEEVEKSTVTGS